MWVLSPMIATASQQAAEAGALQNPVQFLVAGSINIGRPAKKGGTTGKADLLIFGESSVSSLHAVLTVQPACNGAPGAVTITDDSKYGTFVKQQHPGATEQRIPTKQPFTLQQGDILRFGTKCRYKLQQVALNLCATGTAAVNPQIAAAAAACNATLVESCSNGQATHCIAADGDPLTAAALCSLLTKQVTLVTPDWITAVAAGKAYIYISYPSAIAFLPSAPRPISAGKAYANQLPDTEPYTPQQLKLPRIQAQQQQQVLDCSQWQRPSEELLAKYLLVFPPEHQADLAHSAALLGEVLIKNSPVSDTELQAADLQAATAGKSAVLVYSDPTAVDPAAAAAVAMISEQQLLYSIAANDASILQSAVDTFRQQQQQQQQAKKAAVPAAAATAGGDSEDLTEAEESEGVVNDAEHDGQYQAVTPVVHGRKGQQRTPGRQRTGRTPTKSPAVKQPLQLQTTTPSKSRGSKRGAAAAALEPTTAAAAAKTPPGRKRRKTAAAAAASHDEVEFAEDSVQQQTEPQQQQIPAAAATWHGGAVAAQQTQQPQQQQQQHQSTTGPAAPVPAGATQLQEGIYVAPLVMASAAVTSPAAAAAAAGAQTTSGINFKAFQRKENLPGYPSAAVQQQQQQKANGQQHPQQQQQFVVVPIVPFDTAPKGLDVDTFLRDERARLDRLKKADELFNANLKPKSAARAATAGADKAPAKRKR